MSTSKAYPGSCHCGFVQYQVRLQLPPTNDGQAKSVRLYKCNCSTCQKMGFFHCRPINPENDFILISPTNIDELGDYRVFSKTNGWYFCKRCGVRVFGVGGVWESKQIDVEHWAGEKREEEKSQLVLTSKPTTKTKVVDGKDVTEPYHYVSVNAVTLEPSEDIDLRMWREKEWLLYIDTREGTGKPRSDKPHEGGMY
ncbi:hypothetical protein C7974DRAFT_394548 [Boeremia exigua]|uniref:uncharacterized protein n=1 Tax=Boeremia exigua TaxID=749465 RepID=UPI001E8CF9B8|nr:uncharacterized protein C7974DRAFT_394548 [Boeremia exigua]KAH6629465.1 hypothetical protein C7974DRAFT_394548 [Boeremia exigua]